MTGPYRGIERRQFPPDDGKWHLDKRVPVAIIVTMLVQFGGLVWWVSSQSKTIEHHTVAIAKLEAQRVQDDRETASLREQLARALADLQNDVRWIRERLQDRERGPR
jgi:Tfp pilus assembly protein PilO